MSNENLVDAIRSRDLLRIALAAKEDDIGHRLTSVQHNVLNLAIRTGDREVIETLVTAGIDLDARRANGATNLMSLVSEDDARNVMWLLEMGADINVRDDLGRTALHIAAQSGSYDIAKLLVAHGASVNTTDNSGLTPYSRAHIQGNFKVAGYLAELMSKEALG